jgi:hypothetical protein
MYDVFGMLKEGFGLAKEFITFKSKKLDLNNQADVKAAAIKQDEVSAKDKTAKAIATNNLDELRKLGAE